MAIIVSLRFVGFQEGEGGEELGWADVDGVFVAQCMWSSTTAVGLGYATGQDGWVYVVGRYSLPGNMEGSKPF